MLICSLCSFDSLPLGYSALSIGYCGLNVDLSHENSGINYVIGCPHCLCRMVHMKSVSSKVESACRYILRLIL